MSAIYGLFRKNGVITAADASALQEWNGKYGSGENYYADKGLLLGEYIRLLKKNQPCPADVIRMDEYIAVADALIYNREEIEPLVKGVADAGRLSHGELLVRFALENGFDELKRVNGDFAAAIYNTETGKLTLLRDHMGVRPLFYCNNENIFAFSTDIRGLSCTDGVDDSPNEEYVYLYSMGYNELTLCGTSYKNIFCIRPASWTTLYPFDSKGKPEAHVYWEPGQKKIRLSGDAQYIEQLRKLTTDSVERRLRAVDEPVGCELSGGLDSSVLAILINRLGRQGKYYSWSYKEKDLPLNEKEDERRVIYDICKQEHITCEFSDKLSPEDVKEQPDMAERLSPPYVNTENISQGSSWMRANGVSAVISGHGGDEGVSHRCNFYELWYNREYKAFFIGMFRGTKGVKLRIPCYFYRLFRQFFVVHPGLRREFRTGRNIVKFVKPQFAERMKDTLHPAHTFAYDSVAYLMQGGPRIRLDNTAFQGAEAGVQYLFPFLDYRLFDYAVSIPRYLYQNGRGNRWIYREAFRDIMPESLRNVRYKDTASLRDVPVDEVYKREMVPVIRENFRKILDVLDCEPWNGYFELSQLRDLLRKDTLSEPELEQIGNAMEKLYPYVLMQNLKNYKNSNKENTQSAAEEKTV